MIWFQKMKNIFEDIRNATGKLVLRPLINEPRIFVN